MITTVHSKQVSHEPIRALDGCVVYDYYGVRFIAAPDLPPSPYRCPRCAAPFWSPRAACSGRNDSHAGVRVVPQYQKPQYQDSAATPA